MRPCEAEAEPGVNVLRSVATDGEGQEASDITRRQKVLGVRVRASRGAGGRAASGGWVAALPTTASRAGARWWCGPSGSERIFHSTAGSRSSALPVDHGENGRGRPHTLLSRTHNHPRGVLGTGRARAPRFTFFSRRDGMRFFKPRSRTWTCQYTGSDHWAPYDPWI